MSNYKRFITYLFQYDKNDKLGNCGFAKVEQRQNQCRMELHISKCPGQLREIEVCLFARKGEKLPRIILGKLPVRGQRADGVFRFDTEAVAGGNYSFSQICGIVLLSAQGCLIASQWDDEAIDWGNLCLESEEEMSLETDRETELLKKAAESETMVSPEAPAADQAPILSEEPVIEEQTIEDQTVEEAPMHMQSASAWATENVGCPELAGCWADFRRDHVEICPFAGDCKVSAIRFDSVSYTHLDVYKRQECMFHMFVNKSRDEIKGDGQWEGYKASAWGQFIHGTFCLITDFIFCNARAVIYVLVIVCLLYTSRTS